MKNEARGHLLAEALAACSRLDRASEELDRLWLAVRDAVCTRGLCRVTPLGSSSTIPITSEYATDELIAAIEWLVAHAEEARALSPTDLFIKLRGVATRGAAGSARAAQSDALHGMTHVSPGDPVVFADADPVELAS
ncbi:hypothetical protein GCM10027053_21300 [Intrasporangium mesophilum]